MILLGDRSEALGLYGKGRWLHGVMMAVAVYGLYRGYILIIEVGLCFALGLLALLMPLKFLVTSRGSRNDFSCLILWFRL